MARVRVVLVGDHRIAMSFLVLGQRIAGDILVKDCNNIQTSYPDFMRDMINDKILSYKAGAKKACNHPKDLDQGDA